MPDELPSQLVYDPSGVMIPETGLSAGVLGWLAPRLDSARREVIADLELWHSGQPVPKEKQPLDAGFTDLPDRLLDEHRRLGAASQLGQIIATAGRVRSEVDRVVVLGIGGSYMGPRALFEACCHPYHNELTRDERRGVPRIYFEGNNVDNSTASALLDMLGRDREARWAIIVISKSGGTLETAVGFRLFLDLLRRQTKDHPEKLRDLVVPVTGQTGRLRDLSGAIGCTATFPIPDGVGGRFSVLSAVGLVPAAIMGLNVVRLLEGAAAMNRRFRSAPVGANPVLDFVGVSRMIEVRRAATIRVLATWGKRLEAVGLWYDQLLAESVGKDGQGATPLTVVNTRDLHSRGQQHQEGRRDKLITNLYADEEPAGGVLRVGRSDLDQDQLNVLADKTLPEILRAARKGTNQAYRDDRRPTADLRLPRIDEAALGELFQMLMLATVVEGRLMGVNPYGQPGVEAYKKNMNSILRGK